jgi:hypothetical protein
MANRGRPRKVSIENSFRLFLAANSARELARKMAIERILTRQEEATLGRLPVALQSIVRTAWGRHRRYLSALARRSNAAPVGANEHWRLLPKEEDPAKWSADDHRKVFQLQDERERLFGRAADRSGLRLHLPITMDQPLCVGGLWSQIDRWLADQLRVSLRTVRWWRSHYYRTGMFTKPALEYKARRRASR